MVHACYHTLAYSLFFFFFSHCFPFLGFVTLLFHYFLFSSCSCDVVFLVLWSYDCCNVVLLCTTKASYILPVMTVFYHFTPSPLLSECGCFSKPPTSLSTAQPQPLTSVIHATAHYLTKKSILFTCSRWHSHMDKGGHSLSLSLMVCT